VSAFGVHLRAATTVDGRAGELRDMQTLISCGIDASGENEMRQSFPILSGLLLGATLSSCAPAPSIPDSDVDIVEVWVDSGIVDERYLLRIATPPGLEGPTPAIFVLDGDSLLDEAAGFETALRLAEETQPAIIVGVGYGYDNAYGAPPCEGRWRDMVVASTDPLCPAGARDFLKALTSELVPKALAEAPIDPARMVLAGHSLGGRTALLSMIESASDGPFAGYIIADGAAIELLDVLADAQEDPALTDLPVAAYHTYGGIAGVSGLAIFDELNHRIRSAQYPGLRLETSVPPKDDHGDTQVSMFRDGLRWMLTEGL